MEEARGWVRRVELQRRFGYEWIPGAAVTAEKVNTVDLKGKCRVSGNVNRAHGEANRESVGSYV